MRHGQAVDPRAAASDAQRHLTAEGRLEAIRVAEALRAANLVPTQVYTSPLVRAVQTAEAVAHALALDAAIPARASLVPGGKTADSAELVHAHGGAERVLLVSHEPTVRVLSAHLGGLDLPPFPTAGVACFSLEPIRFLGRVDPRVGWRGPEDVGY